ncbi:MAG: hypothetical protein V9G20_09240 [Candidatus Promineifilaceae bacterium]
MQFFARWGRFAAAILFVAFGVWVISILATPTRTTTSVQDSVAALAPGRSGDGTGATDELAAQDIQLVYGDPVLPAKVNLADVPSRVAEVDTLYQRYLNGDIREVNEGPVDEALFFDLLAESAKQGVDPTVQNYDDSLAPLGILGGGASFKSIDYTQSQQGVPPDPDIMVGRDHVVVGVNTSFQVFDKSGNSLYGPVLYADFWGANCGTGSNVVMFDPYSVYDEENSRYVLGITAYDPNVNGGDNGWACMAVSQTDSATGSWYLYSFDGNPGTGTDYFFDYPHIGVGQDALYMGANMFGAAFTRNHVLAFQKDAMYAGTSASYVKLNVASTYFTLQPAKLKGFASGGWPTSTTEAHYFVDANYGNNQTALHVWRFSNPWGAAAMTLAGTLTVNSYSLPVSQPQLGGSNIQGNDNRLLDVEYWGGYLWATHAVGCNPGSGTVNCIRWYQIDVRGATPTLVQQGTFSSASNYRSFPDLAVNRCGDMLVGYTRTSTTMYPGVYVAGREAADAAGTLKSETLVKAGEDFYTAYDSVPRRWGDYTGMALDPDGVTFWYVGEYSRPQTTARWSTWVGSFTWSGCTVGGPTPTSTPVGPTPTNTPIVPTATPTNTPVPPTATPTPTGGSQIYAGSTTSGAAGGVAFDNDDILIYNTSSATWSLYFDGSDVGLGSADVDAFELMSDGTVLISLAASFSVTGLGTVADADIVRFTPTSTGSTTAGTFSWYFDGSDVGLTTTNEDIDAVEILSDGRILVSTLGNVSVTGASGDDKDLLAFTPTALGATTSGTWALYFDASDVGLTAANEDVNGVWVDSNGNIYLTTIGAFTVTGASGDGADIFRCVPGSLGSTTTCTFSLYWDGSVNGFAGEVLDSFALVQP